MLALPASQLPSKGVVGVGVFVGVYDGIAFTMVTVANGLAEVEQLGVESKKTCKFAV